MPPSKRIGRLGAERADASDYTATSPDELARTAELSLERMERAVLIPRDRLQPMPHQPRQSLREDAALHDLARSIAAEGLLQPLVAVRDEEKPGSYLLIAGHRRLAAAGLLARQKVELPLVEEGLDEDTTRERQGQARAEAARRVAVLPATLRDVDPATAFALALVENLQRDDLTRREVMDAIKRLKDEYGFSVREIARRTGRSHTDLSRLLRIAEDEEVAPLVTGNRLSPTAAGLLIERDVVPLREPILAAVRSGHIKKVAQIVAAIAEARARESARVHPQARTEPPEDVASAEPGDNAAAAHDGSDTAGVAHMSQLTITNDGQETMAVPPSEPAPVVSPPDARERTVPVTAHTRRLGSRRALDPARAGFVAQEMAQLAYEDLPADPESRKLLRAAAMELIAYLDRRDAAQSAQ